MQYYSILFIKKVARDIFKDLSNFASFEKEIMNDDSIYTEEKPAAFPPPTPKRSAGKSFVSAEQQFSTPAQKYQKDAKNTQSADTNNTVAFGREIPEAWEKASSLAELRSMISNCSKCPLAPTRHNFVFGEGNPNADILVIGEGPGADEDAQGKPFVGRSGQLLTKILAAIDLSRDDVFIANIVKCRPPNNRRPEPQEINCCEPYLKKQIELIKPVFILALGLTAVDTLLKKSHKMGEIHGKFLSYCGIELITTYHPAALLRNSNLKRETWEDVKYLRAKYNDYLKNKDN